jgi:hypothetical protein
MPVKGYARLAGTCGHQLCTTLSGGELSDNSRLLAALSTRHCHNSQHGRNYKVGHWPLAGDWAGAVACLSMTAAGQDYQATSRKAAKAASGTAAGPVERAQHSMQPATSTHHPARIQPPHTSCRSPLLPGYSGITTTDSATCSCCCSRRCGALASTKSSAPISCNHLASSRVVALPASTAASPALPHESAHKQACGRQQQECCILDWCAAAAHAAAAALPAPGYKPLLHHRTHTAHWEALRVE